MPILSCATCGVTIEPPRKMYCSTECNSRAKYLRGIADGSEMRKRRKRNRPMAEYLAVIAKPQCSIDGCEREHTAKGFCLMHWKVGRRHSGAKWAVCSSDSKARATLYGADYKRFDKRSVFERDGWLCQLCDLPVDQSAAFPHPNSPSLDHIIPISLGGSHSPDNTQCSHLLCNQRKGNRMEVPNATQDAS